MSDSFASAKEDNPPSYSASSNGEQVNPDMYTATMSGNQIHVYMKEDCAEMFRDTTTKIMAYVGDVKKETDMTESEYAEYVSRIQLRIDEHAYKIMSVNLDIFEIQICVETYFKLKLFLGSFLPSSICQQIQSPSPQSDLIPLAYLPPLHRSLKRLFINNLVEKGYFFHCTI